MELAKVVILLFEKILLMARFIAILSSAKIGNQLTKKTTLYFEIVKPLVYLRYENKTHHPRPFNSGCIFVRQMSGM